MTDRTVLAYAIIAVMVLIGAGLLFIAAKRRRKVRRTSSQIDVRKRSR